MSSSERSLSAGSEDNLQGFEECKIGVVVSEWNEEITDALQQGCTDYLISHGLSADNLYVLTVPGSYELPSGARMLDDRHNLDAVICLGCVIKGETRHDEYINQAVANGLMQLGVLKSKPFVFGLLTCDSKEQALDRAGGKHGNKGIEAAATAIRMAKVRKELKQAAAKIGFS